MEWSPSIRPWRRFWIGHLIFDMYKTFGLSPSLFTRLSLSVAVTLPACHPSTCAPVCLQWWAPYWLTSMPTTLTPPRQPTTSLPPTALLPRTLGWVGVINKCQRSSHWNLLGFKFDISQMHLKTFHQKNALLPELILVCCNVTCPIRKRQWLRSGRKS